MQGRLVVNASLSGATEIRVHFKHNLPNIVLDYGIVWTKRARTRRGTEPPSWKFWFVMVDSMGTG